MRPLVTIGLCLLFSLSALPPLPAEDLFGGGGKQTGNDKSGESGGFGFTDAVNDQEKQPATGPETAAHADKPTNPTTDSTPSPDPAEAQNGLKAVSNQGFLNMIKQYANERKLTLRNHGDGPFRIMVMDSNAIPGIEDALAKGNLALQGLEAWSGQQGLFLPNELSDDTINWLIITPERSFDGFVDWARKKGASSVEEGQDDLVKKLKTWGGDRCFLLGATKFSQHDMAQHWGTNVSARMAINAFFSARGERKAPPWLAEGLLAQLEILITDRKIPRITAIAYEENSVSTAGSGNWARDVANLIRERSPKLLRANMVMTLDLVALSAENYKQMWSFCQFIRERCGAQRGEKNRFALLLNHYAEKGDSLAAVQDVLKIDEPALSQQWLAWAAKQR